MAQQITGVTSSTRRTSCRVQHCLKPPAQGWGGYCAEHGAQTSDQRRQVLGFCRTPGCERHGDKGRHGYCDLHYGPALCDCGHAMHRHDPSDPQRACGDCSCINPEIEPWEEQGLVDQHGNPDIDAEIRATERQRCRPSPALLEMAAGRALELELEFTWDVDCRLKVPPNTGVPTVTSRTLTLTVKPPQRAAYTVTAHPKNRSVCELSWQALFKHAGILAS